MTSPGEFPELRGQFEVVVGSLENILSELQGVAADLKLVVNQIDDVTNQIESSHSSPKESKVNRSLSSNQFTGEQCVGAIAKQQQRVSMDSGIQDVVTSPDYVNIDALHLELSSILGAKQRVQSQSTTKQRSNSESEHAKSKVTFSKDGICKQDKYKASHEASPGVGSVKPTLCDKHQTASGINKFCLSRLESNRHRPLKPANFSQEIYSRIVKKRREDNNRCPPQSSISINADIKKDKTTGAMHKSTTTSCFSSYRSAMRPESASDIYERRFEEQLERLDLEQSIDDVTTDRRYYARKGWSSSSAISDPIDLSERLLQVVRIDDDTAYETDDNASEISASSSYSRAIGMKSSDTFKYKLRQHLEPRRNSSGPSWRVVIEP